MVLNIHHARGLRTKRKWCMAFMPFSAVLMVCGSRNSAQSYMGTKHVPSKSPTNCGTLTNDDLLTELAMSSSVSTLVRRKVCLVNPKHQSRVNLVCPTGRNDNVICLISPSTSSISSCIGSYFAPSNCLHVDMLLSPLAHGVQKSDEALI